MEVTSQPLRFLLVAMLSSSNIICKRNETPRPLSHIMHSEQLTHRSPICFLCLIFRFHFSRSSSGKLKSNRWVRCTQPLNLNAVIEIYIWKGISSPRKALRKKYREEAYFSRLCLLWLDTIPQKSYDDDQPLNKSCTPKIRYALLEKECIEQSSPHQRLRARRGPPSPGIMKLHIWISRLGETSPRQPKKPESHEMPDSHQFANMISFCIRNSFCTLFYPTAQTLFHLSHA